MTQNFIDLAKRIERKPWNRPGTDKTWVLQAMSTVLRFRQQVEQSRRVGTR